MNNKNIVLCIAMIFFCGVQSSIACCDKQVISTPCPSVLGLCCSVISCKINSDSCLRKILYFQSCCCVLPICCADLCFPDDFEANYKFFTDAQNEDGAYPAQSPLNQDSYISSRSLLARCADQCPSVVGRKQTPAPRGALNAQLLEDAKDGEYTIQY